MVKNLFFKRYIAALFSIAIGHTPLLFSDFDYTASVGTFMTQQVPIDGDVATGFCWFKEGFILPPSSGTFTVGVAQPVGGTIDMRAAGSTLVLASDLTLAAGATIVNAGSIDGAGHVIFLSDNTLYSGASKTLTISNDLIIDGRNNQLSIGGSNAIAVASGKTLTLRNMTLLLATSATAFSLAATATLVLENVRFIITSNCAFSAGALTIRGKTSFCSAPYGCVFTYSSSSPLTIDTLSELHFDHGFTFKHNHSTDGEIVFVDRSARLRLSGATFESAARALTLQTGTLMVDHLSHLVTTGVSGSLVLGDDTNRLYSVLLPGARFAISGNVSCANAS